MSRGPAPGQAEWRAPPPPALAQKSGDRSVHAPGPPREQTPIWDRSARRPAGRRQTLTRPVSRPRRTRDAGLGGRQTAALGGGSPRRPRHEGRGGGSPGSCSDKSRPAENQGEDSRDQVADVGSAQPAHCVLCRRRFQRTLPRVAEHVPGHQRSGRRVGRETALRFRLLISRQSAGPCPEARARRSSPATVGFRKPAPRSLSCLSDLDGGAAREPRPCRPPGSPGSAPPPPPAPSGCDPHLRPIILRRARSLPSSPERRQKGAGAPGAACRPGCSRQHRVRFADALGLELAQVKVFNAGEDPSVPLHVLSRLAINSDLCCSSQDLEFTLQCLVPDFPPPVEAPEFGERLGRQLVCLERVTCSDLGISGTVRVRNVAFEKQVAVRYTFSDWRSAHEVAARWRGPAGSGGSEDVFAFGFPVPPFLLELGSRVHFALCYRVAGAEHWDNNDGRDYSLTCRNHALHMPRGECEESWIHFI